MVNVWVNGQPSSSLSPLDRGLSYGDGLFETIRINEQGPTLFDLHMTRLETSSGKLGLHVDHKQIRAEIISFLATQLSVSSVLKITITRGVGGRGYNPQGCEGSTRILSLFPFPDYPKNAQPVGVALYECSTRLGLSRALAGMKHLNRLEQVLGRAEWQTSEFAEGLMFDINGQIIEGTMSNLFIVEGDTLVTPDLTLSGVAGVCRQYILDQAKSSGIKTQIRSLSRNELLLASEVFVCNSVFGVWPVISFAQQCWQVGNLTRTVQLWLNKVLET